MKPSGFNKLLGDFLKNIKEPFYLSNSGWFIGRIDTEKWGKLHNVERFSTNIRKGFSKLILILE